MLAALFLLVYTACGILIIRFLLPRAGLLTRLWLGACLGLLLLMWLPALLAFFLRFSYAAHWLSLLPLGGITAGCYFLRDKQAAKVFDGEEKKFLFLLLAVTVPLTVLGGYLQYTHNIRVGADGAYYVGQSTYGDLSLHLSIITSLRDAAFPPAYSIYPSAQLSYPFLMDSLSTSLYMLGFSLQASLVVPGTWMMFLCYAGFLLMAREMAGSKAACVLACLLFFLNGGLGFLYDFDKSAGEVGDRLRFILEGYYKTPTNQPDPNNLRWSNVIADMMVPQRTLLGGWAMAIPCIYLLFTAFRPDAPLYASPGGGQLVPRPWANKLANPRLLVLLGLWVGALPLLHTHSFLALGLMSAGFMAYRFIHAKGERLRTLWPFLLYGAIAILLALPQLINWTFSQSLGSSNFLQFQFNWVNNPGNRGMIDLYLWFYIKNIGLPVILLICALVERNPRHRFLAAGAFCIFIAAEFFRFQPNEYDNNKLFYVWYMLCAILAADYAVTLFRKLQGLRGRYVLAAFTLVAFFLGAGLTLAREVVSNYQVYSATDVEAAAYVDDNSDKDAVFLTGTQHLNPISSLAGRTIICGPDLWLYYHGFDTTKEKQDIYGFYGDPAGNLEMLSKYNVSYILISNYERRADAYTLDEAAIAALFTEWYRSEYGDIVIYEVPESYRLPGVG